MHILFAFLVVLSDLSYAADRNELLEDKVENWARKHLSLGSSFKKVIFSGQEIPQDFQDAKIKHNNKKIYIKNIKEYFKNDKILVDIKYFDNREIISSYIEPILNKSSFINESSSKVWAIFKERAFENKFQWTLEQNITRLALRATIDLSSYRKIDGPVDAKLRDGKIFEAILKKENTDSVKIPISAFSSCREEGTYTLERVKQSFVARVIFDMHFAVLYKDIKNHKRIDIYKLNAAFPHADLVVFETQGAFTGIYARRMEQRFYEKDLKNEQEICVEKNVVEF